MQSDTVDTAPTGRRARIMVIAVLGALLAVPWLLPSATSPEWVDAEGTRWVRVELPEFYERGPDPADTVDALRRHGVAVEVRHGVDLTPWKSGRIVGTRVSVGGDAEAQWRLAHRASTSLADIDLTEFGLRFHHDGGFSVDPQRFRGDTVVTVGRLPGQSPSEVG